jgi:hypothetical protein
MEDKKNGQDSLFEEIEVVISMPYNMPLERLKDTSVFDIKICKHNGEKPFIKVRYPKVASTDD